MPSGTTNADNLLAAVEDADAVLVAAQADLASKISALTFSGAESVTASIQPGGVEGAALFNIQATGISAADATALSEWIDLMNTVA